jgi:hypothetical protein
MKVISYSFASFAFFIFLYSFFLSDEDAYKAQAIYWFYGSLVSTLIPQIKQLKYSELELIFREELKKTEANIEQSVDQKIKEISKDIEKAGQKFTQEMKANFAASIWLKARTENLVNSLDPLNYPEVENIEAFRNDLIQYLELVQHNLKMGLFVSPSKHGLNFHSKHPDIYIRALVKIKHQNELSEEKLSLDNSVRGKISVYMKALIHDLERQL